MTSKKSQARKNRTTRRAEERQVAKAKGVLARAEAPTQPIAAADIVGAPSRAPVDRGTPVNLESMVRRIGALTVERDYWYERAQSLGSQLTTPDEVPPEVQEQIDAAMAEAEPEEEEVIDYADPEDQAAEDAEAFPELQDTDGKVIREEATPNEDDLTKQGQEKSTPLTREALEADMMKRLTPEPVLTPMDYEEPPPPNSDEAFPAVEQEVEA